MLKDLKPSSTVMYESRTVHKNGVSRRIVSKYDLTPKSASDGSMHLTFGVLKYFFGALALVMFIQSVLNVGSGYTFTGFLETIVPKFNDLQLSMDWVYKVKDAITWKPDSSFWKPLANFVNFWFATPIGFLGAIINGLINLLSIIALIIGFVWGVV